MVERDRSQMTTLTGRNAYCSTTVTIVTRTRLAVTLFVLFLSCYYQERFVVTSFNPLNMTRSKHFSSRL